MRARGTTLAAGAVLVAAATLAAAHSGVTNPAVAARMDSMKAMVAGTRTLGLMASGQHAFDAQAARQAAAEIAAQARATPDLFAAREDDPKSEARPAIWAEWEDFTARSDALEAVATQIAGTLRGPDDLPDALVALGAACKACHRDYRE